MERFLDFLLKNIPGSRKVDGGQLDFSITVQDPIGSDELDGLIRRFFEENSITIAVGAKLYYSVLRDVSGHAFALNVTNDSVACSLIIVTIHGFRK